MVSLRHAAGRWHSRGAQHRHGQLPRRGQHPTAIGAAPGLRRLWPRLGRWYVPAVCGQWWSCGTRGHGVPPTACARRGYNPINLPGIGFRARRTCRCMVC